MRVVLFGAGASFGSEQAEPHVPPLGRNLFDALLSAYPDVWSHVKDEREKFTPNFELGMAEAFEKRGALAVAMHRSVAHYFSRFRVARENTYVRFIEMLRDAGAMRGLAFSTLTYSRVAWR